jgi:predicted nucleic acid-binding protein
MEQNYLIDTNVLIEYLGDNLPFESKKWVNEVIDKQFNISVIVGMEVLGHPNVDDVVNEFMSLANVIDINSEVYFKTIEIRKKHKIKLPDAIIASTCLVYNYTLVTRNSSDFNSIEGLNQINPYSLQD